LTITDLAFRTITKHFTDTPLTLNDIKEKLSEVEDWHAEEPKNNVLTELSDCWADQVANFQETFERLIDCYSSEIANGYDDYEQDKIRFVFLIDDLDRCLPDNAISLIENIKNHLTVKNTIFIFCLNPKTISSGIRQKFGGYDIEGQEYLEKILNFSYYVPDPLPDIFAKFIHKSFKNIIVNDEMSVQFQPLFGFFGDILEQCRFNNPRKIKRILNRYLLLISWFPNAEKYQIECDNNNIVRLIILSEYFPSLFSLLVKCYYEKHTLKMLIEDLSVEDMKMDDFENKYGLSISNIYKRMSRELINFNPKKIEKDLLRVNQIARID